MKNIFVILLVLSATAAYSQQLSPSPAKPDNIMPIRGFCIAAPQPDDLEEFIKFIDEELVPRNVNTLILRVDYNYKYESHPELRDSVVRAVFRPLVSTDLELKRSMLVLNSRRLRDFLICRFFLF